MANIVIIVSTQWFIIFHDLVTNFSNIYPANKPPVKQVFKSFSNSKMPITNKSSKSEHTRSKQYAVEWPLLSYIIILLDNYYWCINMQVAF